MKAVGIESFNLNRRDYQLFLSRGRRCCVNCSPRESIADHVKGIKKRLLQELVDRTKDKAIESAILDIENQLVQHRDEIYNVSSSNGGTIVNPDDNSKLNYIGEVKEQRKKFKESGVTYEQWQSKVVEKYEKLHNVVVKYYPDAWTFLEFCLAVKSILNIEGFTLPFMGVILAVPASMKTMIIELFRKYPGSFYTDSFTPNSLVSHNCALSEEKLQQVDMLPKIKDKLVLTPELAPIFTAKDDDLQKVLGIITRILDGHGFENDSGAQGHRRYGDTMFVWLGAAVEIPPRVWKLLGTLGHKIYFLRPPVHRKSADELKKIAKSNNFSANNKEIEDALLDYLKTFDSAPEEATKTKLDEKGILKLKWREEVEEEQDKAIGYIAQVGNLLASLRGTVYVLEPKTPTDTNYNRHGNNTDNQSDAHDQQTVDYDTGFPIIEDPSRAVILLRNLAIGHAVSQGRDTINLRDVPLAIKTALSTAVIRRVKVLDLLLKNGGELTTSQITKGLRISQPIARQTMREFYALGIADLAAIAEYSNSELKITLKLEYDWFRSEEFKTLREGFTPSNDDAMCCDTQPNQQLPPQQQSQSNNNSKLTSDASTNSIHRYTNNNISNLDEHTLNTVTSSNTSNNIEENNDNNASLWGSNHFQHVTQSHGRTLLKPDDNNIGDAECQLVLQQILDMIKETNGSQVAVNTAIQSAYNRSEQVRKYLGDKLTQRENKRVKNLCVAIIRNEKIEVVKHKPQLVVRWKNTAAEKADIDDGGDAVSAK